MAELALLLRLRVLLWWRQWRVSGVLAFALAFGLLVLVAVTTLTTIALVAMHRELADPTSLRLGQIEALAFSVFLLVGPLIGFRAQEFMDVTKLFTLPVRPLWVFLSTSLGSFLGILTMIALPVLVIPAAMRRPDRTIPIVVTTLAYFAVLYATLQCVTLCFLGILRSRRFRDLAAILAPALGLLIYAALQGIAFANLQNGVHPSVVEILESDGLANIDAFRAWLPPLWFAEVVYGEADATPCLGALALLFCALCAFGTHATIRAFHGAVARTRDETSARRGRRHLIERFLAPELAAVYEKERSVQRRDPWTRILLIQQLGFITLFTLGEGYFGRRAGIVEGFPIWLLLYFEAGFLQNQLGIEGSSFRYTAMLPLRGYRLLIGKNLVWLRSFGLANALMVPTLSFLSAWISKRPLDSGMLVAHLAVSLVALPAIFGPANLISVWMPLRVPQRSRRALGQDMSQGGGCTTILTRTVSALIALVPAVLCALWLLQIWKREPVIDATWLMRDLPLATLLSFVAYWICTRSAGAALDARRHRLAELLR